MIDASLFISALNFDFTGGSFDLPRLTSWQINCICRSTGHVQRDYRPSTPASGATRRSSATTLGSLVTCCGCFRQMFNSWTCRKGASPLACFRWCGRRTWRRFCPTGCSAETAASATGGQTCRTKNVQSSNPARVECSSLLSLCKVRRRNLFPRSRKLGKLWQLIHSAMGVHFCAWRSDWHTTHILRTTDLTGCVGCCARMCCPSITCAWSWRFSTCCGSFSPRVSVLKKVGGARSFTRDSCSWFVAHDDEYRCTTVNWFSTCFCPPPKHTVLFSETSQFAQRKSHLRDEWKNETHRAWRAQSLWGRRTRQGPPAGCGSASWFPAGGACRSRRPPPSRRWAGWARGRAPWRTAATPPSGGSTGWRRAEIARPMTPPAGSPGWRGRASGAALNKLKSIIHAQKTTEQSRQRFPQYGVTEAKNGYQSNLVCNSIKVFQPIQLNKLDTFLLELWQQNPGIVHTD